jgi:hypothetical protein
MLFFIRDFFYGASILAGMAIVYTALGTLNGRLTGGFTAHNLPWILSVAVFAVATIGGAAVKVILLIRRRRQAPFRMHPSGRRWVRIDDPLD